MPSKIYLPRDWSDEQIADFAVKYNGQPGHSQPRFERAPEQTAEMKTINDELAVLFPPAAI